MVKQQIALLVFKPGNDKYVFCSMPMYLLTEIISEDCVVSVKCAHLLENLQCICDQRWDDDTCSDGKDISNS